MQVPVYNLEGSEVGEVDLRDDIFGVEPNVAVMHQAFLRQMANARQGTHKTKTRTEVRGGGRKPWRQKGTGRARQGSIRAPHWRGGGTVFGPIPRSYRQKMPRKMRRLALRSALSVKAAEERVIVVDSFTLAQPRTKAVLDILEALGLESSVLLILPGENREVIQVSSRNLQHVKTLMPQYLNVRDLLHYDHVLMPMDALPVIESYLAPAN
jgi:large subunit ribosomal protein L4